MADGSEMGMWHLIGTSIGGLTAGVASVLGLNRVRGRSMETNVDDIEHLRQQIAALQSAAAAAVEFQKTMNRIEQSLVRLFERMETLEKAVSRLEGFEAGRRSREHERGDT